MTKAILPIFMSALLMFGACAGDDENVDEDILDSTLTIQNDSAYAFVEINLNPIDSVSWGADLLGSQVLLPREALEVSGIECDDYDIRVVDDEDDECIVENVDLCVSDETWVIDDLMLAACVAF